jgi:cysteine-rich repeat protein
MDLQEAIRARREFAATLSAPPPRALVAAPATGPDFAAALDVGPPLLVDATFTGPVGGAAVLSGLGVLTPKRGSTFALFSTGIAGTTAPEPGTDFPPSGTGGDGVTLTLILQIPNGANRISFDFNFLSAEYPDYIGTQYNDTFTARLTDSGGSRIIAAATVNSSFFFPAFDSVAGGTGFDIFTEDPAGVDTDFSGGLPDAGVTGFLNATAPVASGETVTLEFQVRDLGDGILDSAVVLDNLTVTSLELIDPNPELLEGSNVTQDTERLATGGTTREGAAADGVTQLLVRSAMPGKGMVRFTLDGSTSTDDDGLIASVDGGSSGLEVEVPTVTTSVGEQAFVVYRVPSEFNPVSSGGEEAAVDRTVTVAAHLTPDDGGDPVDTSADLRLVRPPVVLVHGLWSDAATWAGFLPLVSDPRFQVVIANYQNTNAEHFVTNRFVPVRSIREAVERLHGRNLAATQVDIVGHSMGGILSRNHVALGIYRRDTNFGAGDLHKLVTLDTPHTGSPLGNLLVGIRETPIIGWLVTAAADLAGHPIDRGAIDDLAKGSAAIGAIQATHVPAHAVVGIGGSDALELAPGIIGSLYTIINFFADDNNLFQGLQHDFIVGRESQEGGLPASAQFIIGGSDGIHITVTGSSTVSSHVIDLFNSDTRTSLFAEFPKPSTLSFAVSAAGGPRARRVSAVAASPNGLTITAPPAGTAVTSGAVTHVIVEPDPGVTVSSVLLVGPAVAVVDAPAPFEFDLIVPNDAAGSFTLTAYGTDGAGSFFGSPAVDLIVTPAATLTGIMLLPQDPILFSLGETRQLSAIGIYNDGIVRVLTSASTGTIYLSNDPDLVSVSADGLLSALGVGRTTIVVQNDGFQAAIGVTSEGELVCGNTFVEPGEDCDDGNTLDGDCCSSTCHFEPAANGCADDGNACTDDQCDGAGECQHVAVGNCGTLAASKCDAGKIQCVAKRQACRLAANAKAAKKGVPVDGEALQKCKDKFDGGSKPEMGCIARLEAKQKADKPKTMCAVTGDVTTLENKVDAFVTDVVSEIDPSFPTGQRNDCNPGKKACMWKKASCVLKAWLNAAKEGVPVDGEALQKCKDKFDGGSKPEKGCIAKLEAKQKADKPKTMCAVTGDVTTLENKVDAFVTDVVNEIRNAP